MSYHPGKRFSLYRIQISSSSTQSEQYSIFMSLINAVNSSTDIYYYFVIEMAGIPVCLCPLHGPHGRVWCRGRWGPFSHPSSTTLPSTHHQAVSTLQTGRNRPNTHTQSHTLVLSHTISASNSHALIKIINWMIFKWCLTWGHLCTLYSTTVEWEENIGAKIS